MYESQKKGLRYDPFEPDQEVLEKIVALGVAMAGEKHKEFLTTFARTYGLDFCPVYSVLGSIISQEVIKIAESTSPSR
jgi:ubiquitin-like 1-activating enzyme E1 A